LACNDINIRMLVELMEKIASTYQNIQNINNISIEDQDTRYFLKFR